MKRLVMVSGAHLFAAFVMAMQGCGASSTGPSNTSTASGGTGNVSNSSAGTGNVVTSAGGTAPGTAGTASAAAGTASSVPTAGTGGTTVISAGGSGGSLAAVGGAGGSPAAAGAGGSNTTGAAPAACDPSVAKAGPCTMEGVACAKTCGPDKTGYKAETCTAGVYVEGLCTFPAGADYSCYKKTLPLAGCTIDAFGPISSSACTAAACMPCGPVYQDSKMTPKAGACVCTANKWSCASDKEWPPQ